jgi:hypothetical protein
MAKEAAPTPHLDPTTPRQGPVVKSAWQDWEDQLAADPTGAPKVYTCFMQVPGGPKSLGLLLQLLDSVSQQLTSVSLQYL